MVIPSVDTSSNSWTKQKSGQSSPAAKLQAVTQENAITKPETHSRIEEKKQAAEQEPGFKSFAEESPSINGSDIQAPASDAQNSEGTPDFTLEITNPGTEALQLDVKASMAGVSAPKDPYERPDLPYTFNFGIRRSFSVAVVMSKPLLGNQVPANSSQAIQQTLDLAATNRLPYEKGSQISLVA